jgi:energy-coupling factor transporter ATP-binding protein EcfA2
MEPDLYAKFRQLIDLPHGIILVTGPTGSGKSTTLYSALLEIRSPELKIITTEDPVEYQLEGINQIQVHPKIGLTFANSLRSILRHDPDIIFVGEIRDLETAENAIQASLTGHLVFSTLHTNDAAGAYTRLADMGVEPFLVSSTVEGVMAQRLVRQLCPALQATLPAQTRGIARRFPNRRIEGGRRDLPADGVPGLPQRGLQGTFGDLRTAGHHRNHPPAGARTQEHLEHQAGGHPRGDAHASPGWLGESIDRADQRRGSGQGHQGQRPQIGTVKAIPLAAPAEGNLAAKTGGIAASLPGRCWRPVLLSLASLRQPERDLKESMKATS